MLKKHTDEPSNIKWENLEMETSETILRRICVFFTLFITMLLTFIIVIIANIVKPTEPDNCPSEDISYSDAKDSNSTLIKDCFCKERSLSEISGN